MTIRTMRGIQQPLFAPLPPPRVAPLELKGVVYTKRWVVSLLLDLAGYVAPEDLANAVAVEPASGEGAFLGSMIERLLDSSQLHGRSILDCRNSLIAFELHEESAE